jgi:hypothetical protein
MSVTKHFFLILTLAVVPFFVSYLKSVNSSLSHFLLWHTPVKCTQYAFIVL